jgi:hypothetical protein
MKPEVVGSNPTEHVALRFCAKNAWGSGWMVSGSSTKNNFDHFNAVFRLGRPAAVAHDVCTTLSSWAHGSWACCRGSR